MSVAMSAPRPRLLTHDEPSPKPTARALAPFAEPAQWSRPATQVPSPDPTFVAQLIANAEQFAQAGHYPPENTTDAFSAYRARQHRGFGAGRLTRRMI
jgi:hypothetical protein